MERPWRKLERAPLHPSAARLATPLGLAEVHRILPHRAPLLLIDRITAVDASARTIVGEYLVREDDRVFEGHFPQNPIYPGVLQAEAIGQLGLCAAWFAEHGVEVRPDARPLRASVTRIHHARFLQPVRPGDLLEIHAAMLEHDGLAGTAAGQIYVDGALRSVAVFEVYFDD